ncbi:MAG: AraC family transcriptional regulator [Chthoniobacteraceae bacterium]
MKPSGSAQTPLRRDLARLPPPASLFSGARIEQSFAPDNIIFFQRTDATKLRPEGVSTNYHHRFELVSVFERAAPLRIDRGTHLLQPGEGALIFPNQFHHFMDVEKGELDWLFITFECHHADRIQALRDSPRVYDAHALDLLRQLVGEYVAPRVGGSDHLFLSFTLARLLEHLATLPLIATARRDIHSSDDLRDQILEKINRHVREHLDRAVSIGDLARVLGYSVSHLRAVFRDRLGVSLGRYMRESRLSEAAKLLQSSDASVSAIGERCGFESLYAFSRAFRKAYGLPPRSYRQLVRQGAPLPAPASPL